MPKRIEIPIVPKVEGVEALENLVATLKRIAGQPEPLKTIDIDENRYRNAVLAVLTRIADALDAIHGTFAEATRPDVEVRVKEADDDPE